MKTRQIILFILFLFPFNFCDSTDPKPPPVDQPVPVVKSVALSVDISDRLGGMDRMITQW